MPCPFRMEMIMALHRFLLFIICELLYLLTKDSGVVFSMVSNFRVFPFVRLVATQELSLPYYLTRSGDLKYCSLYK